jgi:hypothetical protein
VSADAAHAIDYEKLFASIDRMDVESFLAFIAPSGTFRFGSAPPVQGRAAIGEAVGGFFSSIAGLQHDVQRIITDEGVAVIEGEATYTRHDTLSFPITASTLTSRHCSIPELSRQAMPCFGKPQ